MCAEGSSLKALVLLCRFEQYEHDTDDVRVIIAKGIARRYFKAVHDVRDTSDNNVCFLRPSKQYVDDSRATPRRAAAYRRGQGT
jgi:hypothetical protein